MKKLILLPLAALFAQAAVADEVVNKQVTVTATIPTATFFVEGFGSNWMNEVQDLAYDPRSDSLYNIDRQIQVKSTIGPIEASLVNDPQMSNGAEDIPLKVSIDGKALSTVAQKLTTAAGDAKILDFQIAAIKPATGYKPGAYQGMVNMMFETAAP